jgi:Na+/H+ antiporter NhaD/arsenite permease-like protein
MIPIIVLLVVFVLIAVRQVGNIKLQIWQVMLLGASSVLLLGQISPADALNSINLDVILFLVGVFIIGQALEESGYLSHLSYRLFHRAKSLDSLILLVLFGMGILSALLMNDTLAIIGTPVVLSLAKKANTQPKILLLSLAFAVTIGSVMSPIGNPQNLLIAIYGDVTNPFVTFLKYLLLPTLLNLFLAYLLLRLFYGKHFHIEPLVQNRQAIKDPKLAMLSKISLILMAALIMIKIAALLMGFELDIRLTYIALIAAIPVVVFLPKRIGMLKRIDWYTLIFFVSMFVLMQSVWNSGIFQSAIEEVNLDITSTGVIFAASILLSQFLSNVPLVALYLPLLMQIGLSIKGMLALAVGSTIAGNFTILGAASNVIIIQNAEKRSGDTLTFWEFARIGVPLTMLNVVVYWLFLSIL